MTDNVSRTFSGILVIPKSCDTHWTRYSEKLSAAKALPKNPANVIPIWIVDKNPEGSCRRINKRLAVFSPSSALMIRQQFLLLQRMHSIKLK